MDARAKHRPPFYRGIGPNYPSILWKSSKICFTLYTEHLGQKFRQIMADNSTANTGGKVITCKAAVAYGRKQPLVIEEVQVDPPQALEVRVKITHTSLCHTDITFWLAEDEMFNVFPRILGHEGAGIVESVGNGVTDLHEGDHVVLLYTGECGDCVCCKSHKTNLCEKFRVSATKACMISDGKSRFSIGGKPIHHFMNTSTFSEYTVVDSACAMKVDPKLPLREGCLLGCGVATGIGAAWNTANVEAGSTVAIFGLGTVGLAVAEGARTRGASRIIGIDVNPLKFAKAKVLGVTECINPKDHEKPINEVIKDISDGRGVDYTFECCGNIDVLYQAILAANDVWGIVVMLGMDSRPQKIGIHPFELLYGKRIVGSIFGGFKGKTQLPHLIEKCVNKEIKVEEFITHELPFSEINKAFDLLLQSDCLRCVIHLSPDFCPSHDEH